MLLDMLKGGPDSGASDSMDMYLADRRVASNLSYGSGRWDDTLGVSPVSTITLPASSSGLSVRFAKTGSNATVFTEASTGPLVAGRQYLGVISGRIGNTTTPPKFSVYEAPPAGRTRIVHAALGTGPIDFGYFDVKVDPDLGVMAGTTFTPVVAGISYGYSTPAAGIAIPAPSGVGADGEDLGAGFLGVRKGRSSLASGNLSAIAGDNFVVLYGDWGRDLSIFAFNSAALPTLSYPPSCGGESYSPLPCP
jgi:hypothetical protein